MSIHDKDLLSGRDKVEYWLDHGSMVKIDGDDAQDNGLPCLFAGSGFSESDGMKETE